MVVYCLKHEFSMTLFSYREDPVASKELLKEQKRRLKEQRIKKKERKLKRRAKLEKECYLEKMNCFNHDNDHWRTPPYWSGKTSSQIRMLIWTRFSPFFVLCFSEGPFCFCMNANNNTYSCLRTINATHNFLYCEFVTGLVTYYNLRIGRLPRIVFFHDFVNISH